MDENNKFYEQLLLGVREIVREEIKTAGLLQDSWRMGKIAEVLSPNKVKCYVDGSDVAITISCNPDVVFNVDDSVWVINTSRDNKSKFVLCRRF